MAKPKQKQKTNDNNDNDNSSKGIDWDPQFNDDWVVVKKQKVTILIPPLSITEQITIPDPEESNPQTILPTKRATQKSKLKSTPLTTTSAEQIPNLNPNSIPNPKESNPQTILPENTTKTWRTNPVLEKKKSKSTPLIATSVQQVLNPKSSQVPNQEESNLQTLLPEKTTKPQKIVNQAPENKKSKSNPLTATSVQQVPNLKPNQKPNPDIQTKIIRRRMCCQYRGIMVNNNMRAMNVERKLRRAGGLKRWLLSMGLVEIQRIFQGKCMGKFQLVNLTMKKLKDMGIAAVGPRRKLIHALDCICRL